MQQRAELITEKYGEKSQIYEKRENNDNKLMFIMLGLVAVLIVLIIVLIITTK